LGPYNKAIAQVIDTGDGVLDIIDVFDENLSSGPPLCGTIPVR
jgi:hypothetical protein